MYISTALLVLAAASAQANAIIAKRAPSNLINRDVSQGWSLQSSSALSDLHSCGAGAYCPISLHCNSQVNNDQVVACCSDTSDCRGAVEGSPKCADDSWNLWVGYDGNGFCCQAGLVGAYDTSSSVAGVCVSSSNMGSLKSAVLTSTGSGAAATSAAASSSSSSSSPAAASAATTASSSTSTGTSSTPAGTTVTQLTSTETGSSTSGSTQSSSSSGSTTTAAPSSSSANGTTTSSSSKGSSTASSNNAQPMAQGLGLMGAIFFAIAAF